MTGGVPRRGLFVTVEGTDGAGKTTQIEPIRDRLDARGIDCVVTREPGGTPLGEGIRELLLGHPALEAGPEAQLLMVFAARAQHLATVIEPALARGAWVVCDRFTDATYAYQGGAGGLGFARVETIENWVQGTFRPDLTLLFDLPVETGVARTAGRGDADDRFESRDMAFKREVRRAYLELARLHPARIHVIDASRPAAAVAETARAILDRSIASWSRD